MVGNHQAHDQFVLSCVRFHHQKSDFQQLLEKVKPTPQSAIEAQNESVRKEKLKL